MREREMPEGIRVQTLRHSTVRKFLFVVTEQVRRGCAVYSNHGKRYTNLRHTTGRKNGYPVPVTFSKVHTRIRQVFRAGYPSPMGITPRYLRVKEADIYSIAY